MLPQAVGSPPPPSGRVRRDSGSLFWGIWVVFPRYLSTRHRIYDILIIEGARGGGGPLAPAGLWGGRQLGVFSLGNTHGRAILGRFTYGI